MRRTWNTWVSPTIGIVTIGTAKIGFGPACAAAGEASAMVAAVTTAALASRSRRVGEEVFFISYAPGDDICVGPTDSGSDISGQRLWPRYRSASCGRHARIGDV